MTCLSRASLVGAFLLLLALSGSAWADNARACANSIASPVNRLSLESVSASSVSKFKAFYSKIPDVAGRRVMWWNIAKGGLAQRGSDNVLAKNLVEISNSNAAPHVLLLGEFEENALSESTITKLEAVYPYQVFLPYNELSPTGIQAYSRFPLELGRSHVLRWVPSGLNASQVEKYRESWSAGMNGQEEAFYARTIREIHVRAPDGVFTVVPTHLAQPWRAIRQRAGLALGIAGTIKEMFLGEWNPLMVQIESLLVWLNAGPKAPRIVIGDFNMPRGVFGLTTLGFQKLRSELRFADMGNQSSFPTPSSPMRRSYPPMQIDHAFSDHGTKLGAGAVLPLSGSDHFPVYGVFQP